MGKTIYKVGFWSALVAFVAASGYSVAQIPQVVGVVGPPWDGILIYGFSLFIVLGSGNRCLKISRTG